MDSSDLEPRHRLKDVRVTDAQISVDLEDGRTISVPVEWYPRLANATPVQRATWKIIGGGWGIHWPDVDEDINTRVRGLIRPVPNHHVRAPPHALV